MKAYSSFVLKFKQIHESQKGIDPGRGVANAFSVYQGMKSMFHE
jgi:hypothetical protein